MEFHPGVSSDGKRYNMICIHPLDLDLMSRTGQDYPGVVVHPDRTVCLLFVTAFNPPTGDMREVVKHGDEVLTKLGLREVDLIWLGPKERKELMQWPIEFFSMHHPEMANICLVSEKRVQAVSRTVKGVADADRIEVLESLSLPKSYVTSN